MNGRQIMKLENYLREHGMSEQDMFTMKELEDMAKLVKADVIDIMFYLRYER